MKNHVMTMNYAKSLKRIVILFVILAVVTAVATAEPFPADKRCGDAEAAVRGDGEHSRQSRRRTSPRG